MSGRGTLDQDRAPERRADATISQAPVSGTKYTVLDVKNEKIISIEVEVTWTVQPNPLEVHLTIDGVPFIHSFTNPVSTTKYIAFRRPDVAETAQELLARAEANDLTAPDHIYQGRSVKVEVETTGGTVSNISARVKHSKL